MLTEEIEVGKIYFDTIRDTHIVVTKMNSYISFDEHGPKVYHSINYLKLKDPDKEHEACYWSKVDWLQEVEYGSEH